MSEYKNTNDLSNFRLFNKSELLNDYYFSRIKT